MQVKIRWAAFESENESSGPSKEMLSTDRELPTLRRFMDWAVYERDNIRRQPEWFF